MTNTINTTLNAEIPAPPVPAIHPSLLELHGRTYRDLSRPAAAQRAAYHRAKAAQFLAYPPADRAAMAGIGNHWADFTNYGTSPDWTPDYGTQEAGGEGWILHSQGATSSRVVFNYPINDGSSPHTVVRVWMRGAPANGKNSYATLIEPFGADHQGTGVFYDEIDIVEYYGQTSNQRSEFTVYKPGTAPDGGPVGSFVWPTPTPSTSPQAPGHCQTSYGIYLEPGTYLNAQLYAPDGSTVYTWEADSSQQYIPSQSMNLYVGVWQIGGSNVDDPPGPFTGDAWMALSTAQVWTSF
jgi:hypothetical protein